MIFNEIYGNYYNTVSKIIALAAEGKLDSKSLMKTVQSDAFGESITVIPESVKEDKWNIIDENYETQFADAPYTPLSMDQKMWLKALLSDPRIRLFTDDIRSLEKGLEDIPPLYEPGFFVHFDRYADGDDYEDPQYIRNFRTALRGIKAKQKVKVTYRGRRRTRSMHMSPGSIEYSSKDDKFRLIAFSGSGREYVLNFANILKTELLEEPADTEELSPKLAYVEIDLKDERNALERAMLQFSDLQKETVKTGDNTYHIKLSYYETDETEILIRILAFGPMMKVTGPDRFLGLIKERITRQKIKKD